MGVVAVVPTQPLSDLDELWLDILDVDNSKLRPYCAVQEHIRLVPRPRGGGNSRFESEGGRDDVALQRIRLNELVARQQQLVVGLQGIGPGDVVVWPDGGRQLVDVRAELLIVLGLG